MTLVSPKFLQSCQVRKSKILKALFEENDIFSLVMFQKGLTFTEACEWIANYVFDIELPEASEVEIQMMRIAAKEMNEEMKQ